MPLSFVRYVSAARFGFRRSWIGSERNSACPVALRANSRLRACWLSQISPKGPLCYSMANVLLVRLVFVKTTCHPSEFNALASERVGAPPFRERVQRTACPSC